MKKTFVAVSVLILSACSTQTKLTSESESRNTIDTENSTISSTRQNGQKQVVLIQEKAEQGNADAQSSLGYMYQYGFGLAKNETMAVKWYQKSATQGNAKAQYYLGWMYANDLSTVKNEQLAAKWYRESAVQGYADAQYNLGWLYTNGEGVTKSYKQAYMWASLAQQNGSDEAKKFIHFLELEMDNKSIKEAKNMAENCLKSKYKLCG